MKRNTLVFLVCLLGFLSFVCCTKFPIDEDGLLITDRTECYVSNFDLYDTSHQTVRSLAPVIDTTACTIDVEVRFGTDLKNLWPRFSLCEDAKLNPKVTDFTNFSDLENPREYTVISGNRKINKTYTINISVQKPN